MMSSNLFSKVSLVVKVKFHPNISDEKLRFTYEMKDTNNGWSVDLLGNITPPPPKRIIQFDLHDSPDTAIYGLRLARLEAEFPPRENKHEQPWLNKAGLQAIVPMLEDHDSSVLCVLEHHLTQVNYQFGVEHKGEVYWDDPRIYSDGSI